MGSSGKTPQRRLKVQSTQKGEHELRSGLMERSGIFKQWITNSSSIRSELPRQFINGMDSEALYRSQNIWEVVPGIFMLISTHFDSSTH